MDTVCLLAALVNLLGPPLLVIFWYRRTGADPLPALAALPVCLVLFIIGNAIRTGFSTDDPAAFYIRNGLLFGILEEGGKYLAMRFLLPNHDSRRDAVTYGIGHSAYETFARGITCVGLIGTGEAPSDLLPVTVWTVTAGAAESAALALLIFYGIRTGRARLMLPAAVLVHAVQNVLASAFGVSAPVLLLDALISAGVCFAAYRCWRALDA